MSLVRKQNLPSEADYFGRSDPKKFITDEVIVFTVILLLALFTFIHKSVQTGWFLIVLGIIFRPVITLMVKSAYSNVKHITTTNKKPLR